MIKDVIEALEEIKDVASLIQTNNSDVEWAFYHFKKGIEARINVLRLRERQQTTDTIQEQETSNQDD